MHSPGTPGGARRPRGALPQPVVGVWSRVRSVGGSDEMVPPGIMDAPMKHRSLATVPLTRRKPGTAAGGRFGWGGTPLKKHQRGPKLGSGGSEPRRRGQGQKPG
ncbi:MAG: hypothetical protein DRJ38_06910 [Thermoprotei archaeon]|nr:MAG: hypothetical protein DRJ38_06910 [Thermoprotei archaeon]